MSGGARAQPVEDEIEGLDDRDPTPKRGHVFEHGFNDDEATHPFAGGCSATGTLWSLNITFAPEDSLLFLQWDPSGLFLDAEPETTVEGGEGSLLVSSACTNPPEGTVRVTGLSVPVVADYRLELTYCDWKSCPW